jgi:hypothetical protein
MLVTGNCPNSSLAVRPSRAWSVRTSSPVEPCTSRRGRGQLHVGRQQEVVAHAPMLAAVEPGRPAELRLQARMSGGAEAPRNRQAADDQMALRSEMWGVHCAACSRQVACCAPPAASPAVPARCWRPAKRASWCAGGRAAKWHGTRFSCS